MPWLVSVTTEEDVKEDEDVKEQDEEDDEDDEEAEEDKDDGSTHSIVVAELNEAPGRTRSPREFEGRNQTNQRKTKAKAKAIKTRRRRREGSRIPACHSQIRDQTNYDNRRRLIWSIGSPKKMKSKKPCQAHQSELTFTHVNSQANRRYK